MKTKIFSWPKEIYIFWIVDFILGLELIGPVLLIFFKDWGGLNQTQTQTLQSWFTLWIFILEIPTGVYGDVKGKKKSVLIGYILMTLGTIVYSITPSIYLFMLSEFIFALGIAFISGSKEAWMYDISKKYKKEEQFREISATSSTMHMIGMIVASGVFILLSDLFPVQQIFRLGAIPTLLSLILLGFFIKGTDGVRNGSLKPDYLKTAKEGLKILRKSINLKKLTIYISLLSSTSYFVIWLYQEALKVLYVPNNMFGTYRIVLLVGEIIAIKVATKLLRKISLKKAVILIAVIVGLGFLLGGILQNILGTLFVLLFAGGLGLQVSTLMSKEINEEIDSKQRATVLSFIGMVKRLMLTLFNPLVGLLVDSKGVFVAFSVLGVLSLFAIFFKPKKR